MGFWETNRFFVAEIVSVFLPLAGVAVAPALGPSGVSADSEPGDRLLTAPRRQRVTK